MSYQLSAVIITFNEERNIARCLNSLKGVADEIIVVDSFSTDRTEEICRSYGVRFIQHRFEGYASQKNYAMQCASHEVVLSLDADEELSYELRASILAARNNWNADGYYFNRLTNYCGKWIRHSGWYPDRKIRLVNRRKARWGGGEVHEKIIMQKGATTRFLRGDLLHYSYYTIGEHIRQQNHFSQLSAQEGYRQGKRSGIFLIALNPIYTFIRKYFLQLGFLDGYYGLVISFVSAHANFRKYLMLRKLQSGKR